MEREIWKTIPGYDLPYEVSTLGMIRNGNRVLKQPLQTRGYLTVSLREKGKSKLKLVHRLVAEACIARIHGKNFVNHKDGNKLNNVADNLEWVTMRENNIHSINAGLRKLPYKKKLPMAVVDKVISLYATGNYTQMELSIMFKVNYNTISTILRK